MHRSARRRAVLALTGALAAAGLGGPPAASAASYASCSPAAVRPLQRYAAGFVTLDVKVVSCRTAVALVRAGLQASFADQETGTPKVRGYRCRLTGSNDASKGGDPFVEYTCSRGTRRIRYTLVN